MENQIPDTSEKEILRMVIKGFELIPASRGFGHPYTTKNGKATPQLASRINTWIDQNFPHANIRAYFETTYGNLNFGRKKK